MASPEVIMAAVRRAFAGLAAGTLAARKIVVTAGGTREAIDAVRYIGNRSSGKMGRAVADEAYLRGADVVLITTHGGDETAYRTVVVESAAEMADAVARESAEASVLVMTAAVADYRPASVSDGKLSRSDSPELTLRLVPTIDILAQTRRSGLLRVGFAAEAGPRIDRARAKKAAKGVEILVFNDILAAGIGIGSDENEITILTSAREVHVPRTSKAACARAILDEVETVISGR
jgi:phosphopantothenoylcysteine decarboxylase/phosphopantothenate--cysteine ligase